MSSETFNVTIHGNGTEIATARNVTLDARKSAILNITCSVTLLGYGNYSISACAEPAPDEIDVINNNLKSGWIFVTILGDIAEPYRLVDIFDVVKITSCFGKKRGDPAYNPNSDINDDS